MADDDHTLKIDATLAERLRARAEAAGQSVEDYALDVLRRDVDQPGLAENEASWTGAAVHGQHIAGFVQRDAAYWDEIQRICDETERDGGIPLEDIEQWMKSWGTSNVLPPPEPRSRVRE